MIVVNLTPHNVNVVTAKGTVTFPPSGALARCAATTVSAGSFMAGDIEVPLTYTVFGEVQGLPDPAPDTIYGVSGLVRGATPLRLDVISPEAPVRDGSGNIVGCRTLTLNTLNRA